MKRCCADSIAPTRFAARPASALGSIWFRPSSNCTDFAWSSTPARAAGWRSFALMSRSAGRRIGELAKTRSAMPVIVVLEAGGAGHAAFPFIIGLHHRRRHPFHPVGRGWRAAIEDIQIRIIERKRTRLLNGFLSEG